MSLAESVEFQEEGALMARLSSFVKRLGVPVVDAYLFGSRARGDALNESDVDVILVSESFASKVFSKKKSHLNLVRDAMTYAVRIPI